MKIFLVFIACYFNIKVYDNKIASLYSPNGFEQALELRVIQNLIKRPGLNKTKEDLALWLILEGGHYCKIDFLAQFFAVNT